MKNNKKLKLTVLDQSPVRSGGTALQSLEESIELAQACEKAGYHRYWLAEHHGAPSLAGSKPNATARERSCKLISASFI